MAAKQARAFRVRLAIDKIKSISMTMTNQPIAAWSEDHGRNREGLPY